MSKKTNAKRISRPGAGIKGHRTTTDRHGAQVHEGPKMPREMQKLLAAVAKKHPKLFGGA